MRGPHPLARHLATPLGFWPWAVKYYGRLRILALTTDGFAPAYITEEGWNQGDNLSGDTDQVGELVVSGSLPHSPDVRVPPAPQVCRSATCRTPMTAAS